MATDAFVQCSPKKYQQTHQEKDLAITSYVEIANTTAIYTSARRFRLLGIKPSTAGLIALLSSGMSYCQTVKPGFEAWKIPSTNCKFSQRRKRIVRKLEVSAIVIQDANSGERHHGAKASQTRVEI